MSEVLELSNKLLKSIMTDAMVNRRAILYKEDLNELKQAGIYNCTMFANALLNSPYNYGSQALVRVIKSSNLIIQEYFPCSNLLPAFRCCTGFGSTTAWTKWRNMNGDVIEAPESEE